MNAQSILKKYYGYDTFRPGQEEMIQQILEGKDALGIMPTGGGKSICYQIPALLLKGITIVISPLISLMKDQVDTLKEYGIRAELINSTLTTSEFRKIILSARLGAYKILYVAPERLETESFLELVREVPIAMVAVDEAHCVSQWGHDFRPSYKRIRSMIYRLPTRPIVSAFTATATPKVKEDIKALLGLSTPFELNNSFDRPNLYFEVRKPQSKMQEVEHYLRKNGDKSGIIYCSTRKVVDQVYTHLNQLGRLATKYHAGLSEIERTKNQEDFLFDRIPIMVATNAFGMGIDKPNVRFVLHYNMPKNMESYYQEAGRAGRDGEEAECILLFSMQDIMTNRFLIDNGIMAENHVREYEKLNHIVDYCNMQSCLRKYILSYFGQEEIEDNCNNCGSCNNDIEETIITIEAQKILSCVKRMKEQFGTVQVADVLKGANTQKIRSMGFYELSTYGIMREYPKNTIKDLIAFLVAEGYLFLEGTQYPVLKLTPKSYAVLKGEEEVTIKRILEKETKGFVKVAEKEISVDDALYENLRKIRYQVANEHHVQPFMIFPDTTLKDMCRRYPITQEAMLQVLGVGEYKLKKYGDVFIEIINEYVKEHNIEVLSVEEWEMEKKLAKRFKESSNNNTNKVKGFMGTKSAPRNSHLLTYELYAEGKNIEQIAEERDLTKNTVETHLLKCITQGMAVNYDDFIPPEYEEQIVEAIKKCGDTLLKPIKEFLPEEVEYTAIKFTIAKHALDSK